MAIRTILGITVLHAFNIINLRKMNNDIIIDQFA